MAEEALALHLEGLVEDGEATPEASLPEEVMRDPENRSGVAILVASPRQSVRSVRVNVTLPEDVLAHSRSGRLICKRRLWYLPTIRHGSRPISVRSDDERLALQRSWTRSSVPLEADHSKAGSNPAILHSSASDPRVIRPHGPGRGSGAARR